MGLHNYKTILRSLMNEISQEYLTQEWFDSLSELGESAQCLANELANPGALDASELAAQFFTGKKTLSVEDDVVFGVIALALLLKLAEKIQQFRGLHGLSRTHSDPTGKTLLGEIAFDSNPNKIILNEATTMLPQEGDLEALAVAVAQHATHFDSIVREMRESPACMSV